MHTRLPRTDIYNIYTSYDYEGVAGMPNMIRKEGTIACTRNTETNTRLEGEGNGSWCIIM